MNGFRSVKQFAGFIFFFLCAFVGAAGLNFSQEPARPLLPQLAERDPATWKEFRSVEGRFQIGFPGTPRTSSQLTEGPGMTFELHLIQLTTFAEYSVMYADYPGSISDHDPAVAKIVLDEGLNGAVAEVHSELLGVKDISIEGHPGRQFSEKMRDGAILRGKTFLVGSRLYQVAITTPKEDGAGVDVVRFYQATATRFLDSFRLIGAAVQ